MLPLVLPLVDTGVRGDPEVARVSDDMTQVPPLSDLVMSFKLQTPAAIMSRVAAKLSTNRNDQLVGRAVAQC